MKLCLDPGHQEIPNFHKEYISPNSDILKSKCTPGAFGLRTRIPEYEIVLQIALVTRNELIKNGCEVILTRESNKVNLSNIDRAQIANSSKADFCIKIHCNGVRNYLRYIAFWKRGITTLIPSNNEKIYKQSKIIAQIIHNQLVQITNFPNLGIVNRSDLTGFNWSTIPVILLELGYLTSPIEESYLVNDAFQKKIALVIAKGVLETYAALGV
ncbi:N-acetylmuramoyl-L-alanine amidase [Candidatus Poribacteria bacterium]|nr:N-acetylmuramoyl-L-alanine amidase [Candidatus Poribacteria bacterium]